jgi:hypothetical protein
VAQPIYSETRRVEVEPGVVIETRIGHGFRREGFEDLRDIITRHRRAWAQKHLQDYLRRRAEYYVRAAARVFYTKSAERGGKPPTPKQFAKAAAVAADRWYGGDLAALYRVFGERSPVSPVRIRVVPEDIEGFVARVYAALGGVEVRPSPESFEQAARERHSSEISDNRNKAQLANKALEYLRLEETLGRPPTLKEFGRSGFEYRAAEAGLGTEAEIAWSRYERIIRDALAGTEGTSQDDDSNEQRSTSRAQRGKEPHETIESPAGQPANHESEAGGLRQTFDAATQRQPESRQEASWWRRLFGR